MTNDSVIAAPGAVNEALIRRIVDRLRGSEPEHDGEHCLLVDVTDLADALRAELSTDLTSREAVAEVFEWKEDDGTSKHCVSFLCPLSEIPVGTKLYAAPAAQESAPESPRGTVYCDACGGSGDGAVLGISFVAPCDRCGGSGRVNAQAPHATGYDGTTAEDVAAMIHAYKEVAPAPHGMAERRMEAAAKCLYLRLAERMGNAAQEVTRVVTFTTFNGLCPAYDGFRAELIGVKGHPVLGDEPWVTTSAVRQVEYNGKEVVRVVTRNNTYILAATAEDPA